MPRLLMFAPCDNVLVAKDTDSISLITILSTILFAKPPADMVMPDNALGPMRWFIFAHWCAVDGDLGKTFQQRVRLMGDKGIFVLEASQAFTCNAGVIHHRVAAGFMTFPILTPNVYDITLELTEIGKDEWKEVNRYPLTVGYMEAPNDGTPKP